MHLPVPMKNMLMVVLFVSGHLIDETNGVVNKIGYSSFNRALAASPNSDDSDLPEEYREVQLNGDDSTLVKMEESMGEVDDDVDLSFYPRRNRTDSASLNSAVTLDHNYFQISATDDFVDVQEGSVVVKQEPLDLDYENRLSGQDHEATGSRYAQPNDADFPEVKTDPYSTPVSSVDSFRFSDSDSDEFYDSEKSDDSWMSNGDSKLSFGTDELPRKKIRVAFGVDPAAELATTGSVIINSDVWEDPKMHMTPVVELEDVLQIILAWQQNVGETDDIM